MRTFEMVLEPISAEVRVHVLQRSFGGNVPLSRVLKEACNGFRKGVGVRVWRHKYALRPALVCLCVNPIAGGPVGGGHGWQPPLHSQHYLGRERESDKTNKSK